MSHPPVAPFLFKGSPVWVTVAPDGKPVADGRGLVEVRYTRGGKVYRTYADRLEPATAAARAELEAAAAAAPKKAEPAKRSPRKSVAVYGLNDRRGADVAIELWTDGACSGNPGPAGAGVLYQHGGAERTVSEYLGTGTNNIAELTAILRAIQLVDDTSMPVDILTDSSYCIGLLTKGWKPKKNQELVAELRQAYADLEDVRLIKVKGHAGIEGNERADELARLAVERRASATT